MVMVALHLALERTRLGALVRAGVDDRATAETLGIDIAKVFALVFGIGTYLAGVAGVVAAPIFGVYPGMDVSIIILVLIVVVVGGLGSLRGAILGSLLIGFADTFGKILLPQLADDDDLPGDGARPDLPSERAAAGAAVLGRGLTAFEPHLHPPLDRRRTGGGRAHRPAARRLLHPGADRRGRDPRRCWR